VKHAQHFLPVIFCLLVFTGCQSNRQSVGYGDPNPCAEEAQAHIQDAGIKPAEIDTISLVVVEGGGLGVGPFVTGVEAWITPINCKGNYVVVMDEFCRFERVYARGECKLL